MKTIRTIELSGSTRQERLPGFVEDFPYIASWAETGQYNGGMVPWHWHPAVELFYMYSGSLVYETPQGTRTFGPGSGGLVTALGPVLRDRGGQWIGWLGSSLQDVLDQEALNELLGRGSRVTGYDLPYPPSRTEHSFLPDLDRVLDAVDQSLAH